MFIDNFTMKSPMLRFHGIISTNCSGRRLLGDTIYLHYYFTHCTHHSMPSVDLKASFRDMRYWDPTSLIIALNCHFISLQVLLLIHYRWTNQRSVQWFNIIYIIINIFLTRYIYPFWSFLPHFMSFAQIPGELESRVWEYTKVLPFFSEIDHNFMFC